MASAPFSMDGTHLARPEDRHCQCRCDTHCKHSLHSPVEDIACDEIVDPRVAHDCG